MPVKLSVIIPVYNVGNYIKNSLCSLINQENQDFEIIIINDGSTDNTLQIINSLFSQSGYHNFRIISKENGGVSSARNRGIEESKGEYLYFLDGDDYVSNDFMSTIIKQLQNENYDIIAWRYDVVSDDKKVISKYSDRHKTIEFSEISGKTAIEYMIDEKMRIWTCSAIYNRKLIIRNNLFFSEGCTNGEDQEFIFKSLIKANLIYFINKELSFYVQRAGSITNSYNIRKFDAINAMERAACYIRNQLKPNDNEIITKIEQKYILDNYFYNFNSNIKLSSRNLCLIKRTSLLINDIEKNYPGLHENIKEKLRNLIKDKKRQNFKCVLYLLNPVLYTGYKEIISKIIQLWKEKFK